MSYFHFIGSSQSNFKKRKVGACWSLPERSEAFNARLCSSNLPLTALKNQSGGGKSESGSVWFPRCLSAKPAGRLTAFFLFWKAGKGDRDKNARKLPALLKIKQFFITHLLLHSARPQKMRWGETVKRKPLSLPQTWLHWGWMTNLGKVVQDWKRQLSAYKMKIDTSKSGSTRSEKTKAKLCYRFNNKIPCRVGQVPCDFC